MDWLTRMRSALAYVEDNLTFDIDHEKLAQIACCSSYNFFRVFSFMTGISLSEYIRRRRLTLAALELQNSDTRVIDIALKYGYDSPVSFSRAFQTLHGVTPTDARTRGTMLKAYPRISFQLSIKGDKEMDYRIETKEAFQVFGMEGVFKTDESGPEPKTPAGLWERCHADGSVQKLAEDADDLPTFVKQELDMVHGICSYRDTGVDSFPYMVGAFRSNNSKTDGYAVVEIPAHTWVIFPSEKFKWDDFDGIIESLYKRFFTEWLPTSEYEQVGSLDMELYGSDGELGYFELWFAVQRKA
jgi:AraC family transcriptional regulator